jgi:hypothetical protein
MGREEKGNGQTVKRFQRVVFTPHKRRGIRRER